MWKWRCVWVKMDDVCRRACACARVCVCVSCRCDSDLWSVFTAGNISQKLQPLSTAIWTEEKHTSTHTYKLLYSTTHTHTQTHTTSQHWIKSCSCMCHLSVSTSAHGYKTTNKETSRRPFCVHMLLSLHWPELWEASGNCWMVSLYSESTRVPQYLL